MRSRRISLPAIGASLSLAAALIPHLSCNGTTGGDLLNIPFTVGGVAREAGPVNQCPDSIDGCSTPETPFVFTNPLGWTISLTKARAALGPFYFNVSAPPQQGFRDGTVIMEVLAQGVVDPLDPTQVTIPVGSNVPTGGDGFTQTAVSVEIDLFPPDSTQCSCNSQLLTNYSGEASQAYVAGTATKGTATVPFAGWVTLDSSLTTPNYPIQYLQRIAGASVNPPKGLNFTSNNQSLSLQVDPTHWFDQTDFSVFPSIPPDAGTADPGPVDAGVPDAGTSDGGTSDAGTLDAGTSDAGTSDAGASDAGTSDASDAGASDAGSLDAGDADADAGLAGDGAFDAGVLDTSEYSLVGGKYTWTNHSTFHNQLVQGFQATSGVYNFALSGQ